MTTASLRQDLRFALRSVRRNPGYSLVVVTTLAVGIAATTLVFSVMNPYLLRPLPYDASERLIQIEQVEPEAGASWIRFSEPQWADWRGRSRGFEDLAGYRYRPANLTGGPGARRVMTAYTTGNLFSVLGVEAALGRTYRETDMGPADAPVVVLSHTLWTGRYGGDPDVVGRTIRLDGEQRTVIGVMPRSFNFPWNEVRLWVPLRDAITSVPRDRQSLILVGRLAEGWSAERAESDLLAIQRDLGAAYPAVDARYRGVNMRPLREALNFQYDVVRLGLTLLLVAVVALLLLACVNVASLTLARVMVRRREVAVRRALGAGRGRLTRQVLGESVLLAVCGGVAGLLLAWAGIRVLAPILPEGLYRVGTVSLDLRVLLFALGVTGVTPLVFGLGPALAAGREAPGTALRTPGTTGAPGRLRARRGLVVTQVALAVALVASTLLLGRSLAAIQQVDLGFDRDAVVVELTPPTASFESPDALRTFYDRVDRALSALSGVVATGQASHLPLNHENLSVRYGAGEVAMGDANARAYTSVISPGYFQAMDIPLLEGRTFRETDGPDADRVVVVSRSLAERAWPGTAAVGRSIRLDERDTIIDATVVGVVGDVRWADITGAPRPHVYRTLDQVVARRRFIVVDAEQRAAALMPALRRALAGVDPELPVDIRPYRAVLRENDYQWTVSSLAVGAFGAVAVLLAALGIYGLVAFSVARRRRELGIRMALGATTRRIGRLVLGEGLRLTTFGMVLGVALAAAAARLLDALLYGVAPWDPVTYGGVVLLFAAVAMLASFVPARRATTMEPRQVLREE